MKMDMITPCAQCPFRSDVIPYLRAARVEEIGEALLAQQLTFTCHKTLDDSHFDQEVDEDSEPLYQPGPDDQHCAGALILLEKLNRPNQWMRIAERIGIYDRTKLRMDAPVFESFEAMAQAQARPLSRRARRAPQDADLGG